MYKSNWASISLFFILIIVIGAIFYASDSIIWLGDDYYYQFIYEKGIGPSGNEEAERINTLSDVFNSQINHYFIMNGRFVAHVLVQLLCGILGHTWFAVLNSLFYVLLFASFAYLLNKLYNPKVWISIIILTILSLMTKMTPSTQVGYIWLAVPNIIFIKFFIEERNYSNYILILLFLFALISGNCHESYSVGISIGIILFWLANFKRFGIKRYVLGIGYGIGAATVCLSPGILHRAAAGHPDLFQSLFFFIFSLRAVYLLLIISIYKLITGQLSIKILYLKNAFFWNILFACIIFNLAVGVFCNRQLFGAEIMAIIIILRILKNNSLKMFWAWCLGTLAAIILGLQIWQTHLYVKQINRIISKYKNAEDGLVYQDTWYTGLYEYWPAYIWENGYHSHSLKRLLREQYPNKPDINVLPTYLEGKKDSALNNEVYHFKYKPGKVLLIRSKEKPSKFVVERKFFGVIPYQQRVIDFDDIWFENEYYQVTVYDELNPLIYNTNVIMADSY